MSEEVQQVTHPELVAALAKPGEEILPSLDHRNWPVVKRSLANAITACAEVDLAKKQMAYNKDYGLRAANMRILPEITAEQAHILHMVMGIVGEAGELLEAVYNNIFNGGTQNLENIIEEAGDSEFYWEGLRQRFRLERDEILAANIAKLSRRYAGLNYSDSAATARADKVENDTILPGGGELNLKASTQTP